MGSSFFCCNADERRRGLKEFMMMMMMCHRVSVTHILFLQEAKRKKLTGVVRCLVSVVDDNNTTAG